MSKLLFFDIDGTLVDFGGKMPESTMEALHKARANGHKCFICTGRSKNQIYASLLDFGFDGIVAATGEYVECHGKTIVSEVFGEERVAKILELLDDTGIGILFQNRDSSIIARKWFDPFRRVFSQDFGDEARKAEAGENETFSKLLIDDDVATYPKRYSDIESAIFCESPYKLEELEKLLPEGLKLTPSSFKEPDPYSGEITIAHTNKATGIQAVMEYLGAEVEDVIGFGDGANDIDMLKFAGLGVAMGNAQQVAKDAADLIAEDIKDDGLYKAMKELGLI